MKKIEQEIIDVMENKDIYVYGGGLLGKIITSWLVAKKNIVVKAMVVSSGHLEDEEYVSLDGDIFEIKELDKVEFDDKDKVLFINTVISGKETVKKLLKKNNLACIDGFEDYIPDIVSDYSEYYYKKINLDFEKDYLFFNDVKIFNPCKIDSNLKDNIFTTMGDEIIPAVYNDYSLLVEGTYELGNVVCNKGDVVIDAGANVGLFTCYAANKGCKVFAFDPDTNVLKVLEEQKKLYSDNIQIISKGLSDKEETVKFYESIDSYRSSINRPIGEVKETTIELTTIDSMVDSGIIEKVDYIKADIEGAERDMLKGAKNTLKRFAPKLSICTYHCPDDKDVLTAIIKEANPAYIIEYKWRKLYAYVPEKNDKL